ncbi:MAG: DUF551 domain-containing protein [Betaproteobacteria bacterium]|nr:DUF551 domain-containing protein [Betaproteobacteria bacterium]
MSDAERKRLRWIPVTERLPDIERPKSDGVECIVMCSTGIVTAMRYTENRYAKTEKGRRPRWEWNWRITTWEVTHWMSLSDVIAAASAPAPSEDDAQQPRDGEEVTP